MLPHVAWRFADLAHRAARMATETTDHARVAVFLRRTALEGAATAAVPEWLLESIPYLAPADLAAHAGAGTWDEVEPQAFVSAWRDVEGALVLAAESVYEADVRAVVGAVNERALRDVLLAFPRATLGVFYAATGWVRRAMEDVLEGVDLPAQEGFAVAPEGFRPDHPRPVRRLEADEYDVVRQLLGDVALQEVLATDHAAFAAAGAGSRPPVAVAWQVGDGRREVRLLAPDAESIDEELATSLVAAATEDASSHGSAATSTAVLETSAHEIRALERNGYERFFRLPAFAGGKRGTVDADALDPNRLLRRRTAAFTTPPRARTSVQQASPEAQLDKRDPVAVALRETAQAASRRERGLYAAEGVTLVERAVRDGLPVETIVYTAAAERAPDGAALLERARAAGMPAYRATDALMGTLTTTRPLPSVLAAVHLRLRDARDLHTTRDSRILVAEDLQNPDNLGMLVRTADAAGVDALVLAEGGVDPLHKNCVRSSRGGVGRLPLFTCPDVSAWLRELGADGFSVLGTSARAELSLYEAPLAAPFAAVVGNEETGLTEAARAACTTMVTIPMAPGQDSLNVAVAAGVVLFEALRRRIEGDGPPVTR